MARKIHSPRIPTNKFPVLFSIPRNSGCTKFFEETRYIKGHVKVPKNELISRPKNN